MFVAFLLPFLDLAIIQSPMLHPTPTSLSTFLPGCGGSRVMLDAGFTRSFDEARPLLLGLAWLTAPTIAVALTYRHAIEPVRRSRKPTTPTPAGDTALLRSSAAWGPPPSGRALSEDNRDAAREAAAAER